MPAGAGRSAWHTGVIAAGGGGVGHWSIHVLTECPWGPPASRLLHVVPLEMGGRGSDAPGRRISAPAEPQEAPSCPEVDGLPLLQPPWASPRALGPAWVRRGPSQECDTRSGPGGLFASTCGKWEALLCSREMRAHGSATESTGLPPPPEPWERRVRAPGWAQAGWPLTH